MKDNTKMVWIVLGAAVFISGMAAWVKGFGGYLMPLLLGFAGILTLGNVGFKTLFNGKFDKTDVLDVIELIVGLALVVTTVAILPFVNYALPVWLVTVSSISTVVAGGLIIAESLRK